MKSRTLIIVGLCVVAVLASVLIGKTWSRLKAKEHAHLKYKNSGNLPILDLVGLPLTLTTDKRSTLVIFFDPDCTECHNQASEINSNTARLSGLHIAWITDTSTEKIDRFREKSRLPSSHVFGKIDNSKVFEAFGSGLTPHLFLYDPNGSLRMEFKGLTKVETILRHVGK